MSRRAPLVALGALLMALAGWWLFSSSPRSPSPSSSTAAPPTATAASPPAPPAAGTGAAIVPGAAKIALAPDVTRGLLEFARKPWTTVPLRSDDPGHARTRLHMRAIAGRMIDLKV